MMRVCNPAIAAATGLLLVFFSSDTWAQVVPVSSYAYDNAGDLNAVAGAEDGTATPQALIDGLGKSGEYDPPTFFWGAGQPGVIYLEDDVNIAAGQPVPSVTFDFGSAQDFESISIHYGLYNPSGIVSPEGVEVLVDNVSIGNFGGFDTSASTGGFGDIRVNNVNVGAQNGQLVTLLINGGIFPGPATTWSGLLEVEFNEQPILNTLPLNLLVNRELGEISIQNRGGTPVDLKGYTISSAAGALDPSNGNWVPISDGDSAWTNLTGTSGTSSPDLSEYQFGAGTGATVAAGSDLSLGTGSWIQSTIEDLQFEYVDPATLDIIIGQVEYTGTPFLRSDLDTDGDIDEDDWNIYVGGLSMDLSTLPQVFAYLEGDLDGDIDNDLFDLRIFKSDFDDFNNPGAFEAMLNGQSVPEPSSALLLGGVVTAITLLRRRAAMVAVVLLSCFFVFEGSVDAQLLGLYRFETDADGDPLAAGTLNVGDTFQDESGRIDGSGREGHGAVFSGTMDIGAGQAGFGNAGFFNASGVAQAFLPGAGTTVDDFSVAFWMQANTAPSVGTNNNYYVVTRDDADGGNQMSVIYDFADESFELFGIGGPDPRPGSQIAIADNSWHHIVYTRSGDDYDYYFDGVKTDIGTLTGSFGPIPQEVSIGGTVFGGGVQLFDGAVDDVAWFGQGLDQSQVDDIFLGDFSSFVNLLDIRVNTTSGNVTIRNDDDTAITFDGYQIISDSDSLDVSGWNSLDDQNLDSIGAGAGQSWDEGGGSHAGEVTEGFLLGNTTINPGGSVSLGNLYDEGINGGDLAFIFTSSLGTFRGDVSYFSGGGLEGDFNDDGIVDLADYTVWRNNLGADESVLPAGSTDGNGTVDVNDYNGWKNNFGATSGSLQASQVPEPSTVMMLLIAGASLVMFKRLSQRLLPATFALIFAIQSASSALELDRQYLLGDDQFENAVVNTLVGSQFSSPNEGLTLDSDGSFSDGTAIDMIRGALEGTNNATYVDVSDRSGAGSTLGVSFDGDGDYLRGPRLGWPESSDAALVATVPKDYAGIVDRGFQFYAKPNSAGSGTTQAVVLDTNQHGVLISASDTWVMRTLVGDIDTGVSVNFDNWVHVMHVWTAGVGPRLYLDGVAIGASNVGYNTADNTPLVVGANTDDTNPGTADFYNGIVDDLELFVFGTSTGGTVYGDFDYSVDNPIAAATLSGIAGDVDQMNGLTVADITAFVAGWGSENIVTGFSAGDLTTITQGDLNLDGVTDLRDAVLLDQALIDAGLPGALQFDASGTPYLATQTVPEPTAWGSIAVGALLFVGTRRRLRGRRL